MTMFSDDSDLVVFPARDAAFTVRTRLIRYSDGTEVVVNYGRRPFAHLGESVPPRSYRVFPPDGAD